MEKEQGGAQKSLERKMNGHRDLDVTLLFLALSESSKVIFSFGFEDNAITARASDTFTLKKHPDTFEVS